MLICARHYRLKIRRMEQLTYRFPAAKQKKQQKWRTPSGVESPFPVPISSIHGLPASNDRWNYFTGRLVGTSIYVDDTTSASSLYQLVVVIYCVVLIDSIASASSLYQMVVILVFYCSNTSHAFKVTFMLVSVV